MQSNSCSRKRLQIATNSPNARHTAAFSFKRTAPSSGHFPHYRPVLTAWSSEKEKKKKKGIWLLKYFTALTLEFL